MIIVIPARYESTRFPGKPLAILAGMPMIQHVYENALRVKGARGVYVATDDERIMSAVALFGGQAIMTSSCHSCGTDRVNECATRLGVGSDEVVVNLQGDEPFLSSNAIETLASVFEDESIVMASLMKQLTDAEDFSNPNVVKVVTDARGYALYFSRYPVPFNRDGGDVCRWAHIGAYAYRAGFLNDFVNLPKGTLEQVESLEQLRALENGFQIRMVEISYDGFGIDTPEQLAMANILMEE